MDITGILVVVFLIIGMPISVYVTNLQEEKAAQKMEIRRLKKEAANIERFYSNLRQTESLWRN